MSTAGIGRTCVVLGAASLSFGSLAAAQDGPLEPESKLGSRVPQEADKLEKDVVRVMLRDMARCIENRNPEQSRELLRNSDPTAVAFHSMSFAADELHRELSLTHCLEFVMSNSAIKTQLRFSPSTLRGMLAEAVYLADNESAIEVSEGAPEFLPNRFFAAALIDPKVQAMGAFADCVVYTAPTDADALLRTRPGTGDERQVIQALVPALSNCIVEGQEMAFEIGNIRAIVADGLWSRSYYGPKVPGGDANGAAQAE